MTSIAKGTIPRKGFVCIDERHGFCGQFHETIREAVVCNDIRFELTNHRDDLWDGWPCAATLTESEGRILIAYEAKAALAEITADPCLNGGPTRDHAADKAEVRASVAEERVAELAEAAERMFPRRVRRARRRPSAGLRVG